jgi:hypothetical protein
MTAQDSTRLWLGRAPRSDPRVTLYLRLAENPLLPETWPETGRLLPRLEGKTERDDSFYANRH